MRKFLVLFCAVIVITASILFDIYKVDGNSMEPVYEDGCIVLVKRNILNLRKTVKDDIVVFRNPVSQQLNIKRCYAADGDSVFVTGFNLPESTDSRHFGSISASEIRGWVWIKI